MSTDGGYQGLVWNPATDVRQLLAYHFMVNALEAGAAAAVAAAAIGWFMVLRRQAFAGHSLAVVAFPGAAGAAVLGLPLAAGYFGACAAGALGLAGVSADRVRGRSREAAAIGTFQAFALGLGFLFVGLYHGLLSGASSLLFGSFLGVSDAERWTITAVAAATLLLVAVAGRPLLYASVDPAAARAAGVRVRLLSLGFLLALGLAVGAAGQITGTLLVFALLVMPPAAAQLLERRPLRSLLLSIGLGVGIAWLGLAIAFYSNQPVGFCVTTLGLAVYVAARIVAWRRPAR